MINPNDYEKTLKRLAASGALAAIALLFAVAALAFFIGAST